jgi:hypothetical protein
VVFLGRNFVSFLPKAWEIFGLFFPQMCTPTNCVKYLGKISQIFYFPKLGGKIKKNPCTQKYGSSFPITLIRSFMIFLKTNKMKPQQYGWHSIALIIALVNDLKQVA